MNQAETGPRGSARPLKNHLFRANYAIIGFFILQIIIDLAHSVTAFPVVHYGMFSGAAVVPDSLPVFRITVNGKTLDQADYRIYRWDMITGPLGSFDKLESTGDFSVDREKLRTSLAHFGGQSLYRAMEPNLENAPDLAVQFPRWYRHYLGNLLGYTVDSLRVDKCWYTQRDGQLHLLRKVTYITL